MFNIIGYGQELDDTLNVYIQASPPGVLLYDEREIIGNISRNTAILVILLLILFRFLKLHSFLGVVISSLCLLCCLETADFITFYG